MTLKDFDRTTVKKWNIMTINGILMPGYLPPTEGSGTQHVLTCINM